MNGTQHPALLFSLTPLAAFAALLPLIGTPSPALAQAASAAPVQLAQASDPGLRDFHIPASALDAALARFAQQTGITISTDGVSLQGRVTRGVKGRLSVEHALRALLVNTGLRAEAAGAQAYALRAGSERAWTSAQSPNPQEPAIELDAVTVTADSTSAAFKADVVQVGTFRNQSILDVPLTISVATRALLDAQAAQDLGDVLRNTPGVTQQNNNPLAVGSYVFRGVQTNARTSYRLNGSLPAINLVTLPLENKQRVEVLKGVSALYYGFTSPSAIVNMVTKRAGREPYTAIALAADSDGTVVPHLDAGRSFGAEGQFGARLNLAGGRLGSPVDGAHGHRSLASGAFDWRASSQLAFKLDVESYRRTMDERGIISLPAAVDGRIALPAIPSPANRYAAHGMTYKGKADNVLLRGDYIFNDDWTLLAEIGQSRASRTRTTAQLGGYDIETGWGRLSGNYQKGQNHRNRIGRLELGGYLHTGALDHALTLGVNWHHQYQAAVATHAYSGVAQNVYHPVAIDHASITWRAPTAGTPNTIIDRGVYVMDRITFSERWAVLGGLRAAHYTQHDGDITFRQSKTTPSLSAIFSPTQRSSIYASYIEGLEATGTAPDSADNAGRVMEPTVSKQYELGWRAELAEGLLASIGLFRIDRALAYINASNVYVVDGKARYQGIEAAVQGDATPRLSVMAAAGWLRARQRETGIAAQNGRDIGNAPRWSASLFGQYKLAALEGLALNGGAYYTGARYSDALNLARLPGHVLLAAGGSYHTPLQGGGALTVRLNVDNLTNKRYWATGWRRLNVGQGRTARLSATYVF